MIHSTQDDGNPVEATEPRFDPPKESTTTWIHRFTYSERLLHWTNAVSYLLLAITGLALFFFPLRRATEGVLEQLPPVFGQRLGLEEVHILAAIVFVFGPILWIITGHRALWADARNILRFDKDDRTWLVRALSFPRRVLPPQGRFNAGQKLNAIIMVIAWGGFLVTGLLLMHWPPFGAEPGRPAFNATAQQTVQQGTPGAGPGFGAGQPDQNFRPSDGGPPNGQNPGDQGGPGGQRGPGDRGGPGGEGLMRLLHELFALVSITLVAGHIYMATLNPSTRHSLRGMWGGFVRRNWAREHHAKWVEEEESKAQKA
jgi:cytochrome b subunit of formate dehydrogenase